jgi:hypothetical protein
LLSVGLDVEDAIEVIATLRAADSAGRVASTRTGEWLYVFRPDVAGATLYLKLAVRRSCIVVSFHEDAEDDDDQEG